MTRLPKRPADEVELETLSFMLMLGVSPNTKAFARRIGRWHPNKDVRAVRGPVKKLWDGLRPEQREYSGEALYDEVIAPVRAGRSGTV
jgi:hypothetical protein